MFPVELPRRLIRMYTFWGELVLDPFLGSGTTTLAALLEGRSSVGYELNPQFERLIRNKLEVGLPALFEDYVPPVFLRRDQGACQDMP